LLCAPAWAEASSSTATVTCKDGTTSNGGRGACHGHGGVDKTKAANASDATTAEPSDAMGIVVCKDGSSSKAGRGACHGHGGVDKTKAASAAEPVSPSAAPASAAPPAPAVQAAVPQSVAKTTHGGKAASDDPAGAIAKCKDGKYWHGSTHSGSCSHHGGVDTWLDGSQK
jgi:hypothetical protein